MSSTDVFHRLRDDHARVLSELEVLEEVAGRASHRERCFVELGGLVVLLESECEALMRA